MTNKIEAYPITFGSFNSLAKKKQKCKNVLNKYFLEKVNDNDLLAFFDKPKSVEMCFYFETESKRIAQRAAHRVLQKLKGRIEFK